MTRIKTLDPTSPHANRVALERLRRDTLLAARTYVARRNIVLERPCDESALADLTRSEIDLQVNALAWAMAGQAWVESLGGRKPGPSVIIVKRKEAP